jgi:hypothetical protein
VRRVGKVVDADGQPVVGALVAVVSGTAPTPEIGIRSGAEGRFVVALPAGTFTLEAREGIRTGRVEVEGGSGEDIAIRLTGP